MTLGTRWWKAGLGLALSFSCHVLESGGIACKKLVQVPCGMLQLTGVCSWALHGGCCRARSQGQRRPGVHRFTPAVLTDRQVCLSGCAPPV